MAESVEMRRKDSNWISFFAGTLLISTLITIFSILIPPSNEPNNRFDWTEIYLVMPPIRWAFMLFFALALISIDVYILRKYRINYMFIFGLDPDYKLTHV